jgi:hypothetical protein
LSRRPAEEPTEPPAAGAGPLDPAGEADGLAAGAERGVVQGVGVGPERVGHVEVLALVGHGL